MWSTSFVIWIIPLTIRSLLVRHILCWGPVWVVRGFVDSLKCLGSTTHSVCICIFWLCCTLHHEVTDRLHCGHLCSAQTNSKHYSPSEPREQHCPIKCWTTSGSWDELWKKFPGLETGEPMVIGMHRMQSWHICCVVHNTYSICHICKNTMQGFCSISIFLILLLY